MKEFVFDLQRFEDIYNDENDTIINGTSGNDDISNNVTEKVTISTGSGNDYVYNNNGYRASITTGSGQDSVINIVGSKVVIDTGSENDYVYNNNSYRASINTGEGNDLIKLTFASNKSVIIYSAGDGSDKIYGFDADDTLSISGGSYSTTKSGKNIIVTVGNGEISLIGAASLSAVNIVAEEKPAETNKWTLHQTTATYGTSSKTLVTVKGVKSLDGLSISGKVVTVAASSLNKKKVSISGDGYTLKLGSDVGASSTKKAAFSLKGTTAIYKSSYKTAGYTLASDGKSISYTKATTAESLATIKGAASKTGLSVSGNKITLKKSALKNKVTVSGGYEFDFASDYKKATISGSSNADSITTRGSNLSINGGAGDDTIKVLGSNTTVTGGKGSDTFIYKSGKNVISDYAAEDFISITSGTAKVTTSGNDVVLTAGKCTITVTGGKNEKITYFDAGGKKTYAFSDTASTDIKFNKDKTSATLLSSYDPDSFAFSDKLITLNATAVMQPLMITGNKKKNNITGSGEDDYIDGGIGADTIKGGKGNDTLIGGAGNDSIHGGEGSDSLWGGAGDDTLYGGDGSDVFIYNDGEGNDRIFDYNPDFDTIKLLSGTVKNIEDVGNDVVFTIGTGKIVLDNAAGRYAAIIDSSGEVKPYNPKNRS